MPPPSRQTILPTHLRASIAGPGTLNSTTRNITTTLGGQASLGGSSGSSANASPILLARINEKKAELEKLRELKILSAQMAAQMQALEERLSTLDGGTEAIALVLSNWHNVLGAINMASMAVPRPNAEPYEAHVKDDGTLPQTLVRIPVQDMEQAKSKATVE